MAPFGYSAWLFLKNNPIVLYIAGGFAFLATFLSWQRLRDGRIRREEKKRVVEKIEATEDKLKEAANEAENRITADLNTGSLRDVAARSPENLGPVRRD